MTYYLLIIRSIEREPMLRSLGDHQRCLRTIKKIKSDGLLDIKAYCVMPFYVKLVVGSHSSEVKEDIVLLDDNTDFVWKYFKTFFPGVSSFQSHCIKISSPHRITELIHYIECAPVRAGIVREARLYQYSSAYA